MDDGMGRTGEGAMSLSERARRVCEWFGIEAGEGWMHEPRMLALPEVRAGEVVLVTGASGSGKSSLLRAVASGRLPVASDERADSGSDERGTMSDERGLEVIDVGEIGMPGGHVVDLFPELGLEGWLGMLARAGLAEAQTYLLPCTLLSEGQQWRLRIALVMGMVEARPGVPRVLVCDEFCALLDRVTACVVARALRKLVDRNAGLRAVVATSHDDLEGALRPDVVVECDFGVVRTRVATSRTNEN
jgi:ABC-type ATPase with predicted acetyltransferase domain